MKAPIPPDEDSRIAALREYDILDTSPEQAFDDLTFLASWIMGVPIALISLVDTSRQWFKSHHGLAASETTRDASFCAHAIWTPDKTLVVPDARTDPIFVDNPLVTGDPNIVFYAGVPLVTQLGMALGTLCVIDRVPRILEAEQESALQAVARQVMAQLELRQISCSLQMTQWELETAIRNLERESTTDKLTGALNRRGFDARLAEEVQRSRRTGRPMCLALIDVDLFKTFNDSFGHTSGDEVLAELVTQLRDGARATDIVARYGGEEFALIMPDTDREGARIVAERCRLAVEAGPWELRAVTVSMGVASWSSDMADDQAIVRAADTALYRAKNAGRNRVEIAPDTRLQLTR